MRRWRGRIGILLCLLLPLFPLLTLPVAAVEDPSPMETMPPAFGGLEDSLPPEVAEAVPEGLFSADPAEALAAAREMSDWEYLLNAVLNGVGLRLTEGVELLCTLVGLLLLGAVLERLREALGGESGEVLALCLRLALYAAVVAPVMGLAEVVTTYFGQLHTLTVGMLPVMGGLYAAGGNLGQAALNEELLLLFLSACQYISGSVVPPLCGLCMALALFDALGARPLFAPLGAQVKAWFTGLMGLLTFLLSLALGTQTALVGRADTVAMRGVKYALGNAIPVVGGAVAGTLGTVAAGVELLRGICGTAGVVLVFLLLLPTLIQLFLFRGILRLAGTLASLLGCDGESRLLGELASLYGYMMAAVALASVLFLLALGLLIHSAAAIG